MTGRLAGRTAIVTGASRGLGRAIAVALAAEGAKVAVAARTEQGAARVIAFDQRGHGTGLRGRRPFRLADCADDAVAVAPTDPLPPDGELADVAFVPVDEAESFPLPRITRVMLRELAERIAADPRLEHDLPAPFFVPVGNTHRRETI